MNKNSQVAKLFARKQFGVDLADISEHVDETGKEFLVIILPDAIPNNFPDELCGVDVVYAPAPKKICPYCNTKIQNPETYLDDHEECFPC
jgi:hypothetical protein